MSKENVITLYPSSWLYNAGVIGFLKVLEAGGENVESFLKDDGSVEIEKHRACHLIAKRKIVSVNIDNAVSNFDISELAYHYFDVSFQHLVEDQSSNTDMEKIKKVWGKLFNTYYRGFFNANTRYLYQSSKRSKPLIEQFSDFVDNMLNLSNTGIRCDFCLTSNYNFNYKNKFTSEHHKILGASENEVPNSFWFLKKDTNQNICDFCSYILIHHHLSLTKLQDNSEIFINAPSFKLMWYLNKYAETLYGKLKAKEIKEILGMSLIEIAIKLNIQLGRWEKMNIEVVSKYGGKIEFFSLPSEVIDLLTDRDIASLLNQIGEFKILNMVLDGKFKNILEFGERIFRIALKSEKDRTKSERDYINENIKLERNKKDLINFSHKLFKLYALIETKLKKEVWL